MNELYKKHRPKRFRQMVGNENTIRSLQSMLSSGTLPHTLLFYGPSGCGKTTLARILKRELGCKDIDFVELNSASFRGVDTIREVASGIHFPPTASPCRIWLLDEVHKLTNDAQNAALKMLEDTPGHVYFFLCTTMPEKLIKPIRTRCCAMPVRLLTYEELECLLHRILRRESILLSEEVQDELIASAQGCARTLLVLLDKVTNLPEDKQKQAIAERLEEENEAIELCRALIKGESWKKVAGILKNLKSDPEATRWAVLGYARSVLLNSRGVKDPSAAQAFLVIDCFGKPFYDSKEAGLVAACYDVLYGSN